MGVFQRLNDQGITVIMVTHEPDIAAYCKRNIVMRDGNILSDSPVTERTLVPTEAVPPLAAFSSTAPNSTAR